MENTIITRKACYHREMTYCNDNVMEMNKKDLDISKFLEEFNKMKLFFTNGYQ